MAKKAEELMFELAVCTQTLLREIANNHLHQRDIAQTYRLALESREGADWPRVNRAIIKRWSLSGLERVKELAWSGRAFRSKASPTGQEPLQN